MAAFLLLLLLIISGLCAAGEKAPMPDGAVSSRSFVDQSQIVSRYTTELYAHQSSLRIVRGIGYAVYQCNETTPEEN